MNNNMKYFAKINVLTMKVSKIIVADENFKESLLDSDFWIETSINTRGGIHYEDNSNIQSQDQSKALRKNFAGIGYTYDQTRDVFISPKPYNSWTLNETTCLWEAPIPYPTDGQNYTWNETNQTWDLVE